MLWKVSEKLHPRPLIPCTPHEIAPKEEHQSRVPLIIAAGGWFQIAAICPVQSSGATPRSYLDGGCDRSIIPRIDSSRDESETRL